MEVSRKVPGKFMTLSHYPPHSPKVASQVYVCTSVMKSMVDLDFLVSPDTHFLLQDPLRVTFGHHILLDTSRCDILSLVLLTVCNSWSGVCRATFHWGVLLDLGGGWGEGAGGRREGEIALRGKCLRLLASLSR